MYVYLSHSVSTLLTTIHDSVQLQEPAHNIYTDTLKCSRPDHCTISVLRREASEMASVGGINTKTAQEIIAELKLKPHPEKGYFIETFRDSATDSTGRAHSTQIYYLLEGESGLSHWHRVTDAVEVWHYYAGAPLQLSLSWDDGKPMRDLVLGTDITAVSIVLLLLLVQAGLLTCERRANDLRLWSNEVNGSMRRVWVIGHLWDVLLRRLSRWKVSIWQRRDGNQK